MKDFIYNLYSNDNFTVILTIILVILVIAFFIVLFFGKKDKKLQETQRLQKLNDAFKEEKTEEKVEVAKDEIKEENKDSVVIVKPMDEPPFEGMAEEVKTEPMSEEPKVEVPPVKPIEEIKVAPVEEKEEVKLEEEKPQPLVEEPKTDSIPEPSDVTVKEFNPNEDMPDVKDFHFDELSASLEKELTALENIKNEFNNINVEKEEKVELPKENKEEIELPKIEEKKEKSSPQVFSSVFVKKESIEDTAEFDLPTLKEEKKPEVETKEEKGFSFNDIEGESYNLNDK